MGIIRKNLKLGTTNETTLSKKTAFKIKEQRLVPVPGKENNTRCIKGKTVRAVEEREKGVGREQDGKRER